MVVLLGGCGDRTGCRGLSLHPVSIIILYSILSFFITANHNPSLLTTEIFPILIDALQFPKYSPFRNISLAVFELLVFLFAEKLDSWDVHSLAILAQCAISSLIFRLRDSLLNYDSLLNALIAVIKKQWLAIRQENYPRLAASADERRGRGIPSWRRI
jgi:hypothetical protein